MMAFCRTFLEYLVLHRPAIPCSLIHLLIRQEKAKLYQSKPLWTGIESLSSSTSQSIIVGPLHMTNATVQSNTYLGTLHKESDPFLPLNKLTRGGREKGATLIQGHHG